jgi:hypothetical protein
MRFEKPAKEVLKYLFSEYQKGPSVIYRINRITKKHSINAVELSDYMLDNYWIRERWIYPGDIVACRITIRGIEEIDPVYVRSKLAQVIGGLANAGGSKDLLEILEFRIEEYSITLDLVKQLEILGLVAVHHLQNTIVVELTDKGRAFYEKGSRTYFTLIMA